MENNDSHPPPSTVNQHFLQPISSSNLARIKIPDSFFETFKREERGKQAVTLFSVPLSRAWRVTRDGRRLTDGWREFTKEHRLAIGDYVIFKHKGNSFFEVTILGSSGSQRNYLNNESGEPGNRAGNLLGSERTPIHESLNAGSSLSSKKRAASNSQRVGNSALQNMDSKQYRKTVPGEPNVLYQAVTESNLNKNAVYIPKNFVNIHGLEDKNLEQMALTTTDGYVWIGFPSLCSDGRVQINGGWSEFCLDKNFKIGDCCKFRLIEDAEFIVLEFVGLLEEIKNTRKSCMEESGSLQGTYTPASHTAVKIEKGQSSKR